MAQSTSDNPLTSMYRNRIGPVSNDTEVTGYWVFATGVVLGIVGLLIYFGTDTATMVRGFGYAVAALSAVLLLSGAVLRFPLKKTATYFVALGGILSAFAIGWFLVVFPEGWSSTTGNTGIILTYVAGLGLIGLASGVVPLEPDEDDDETEGDELAMAESENRQLRSDLADASADRDNHAAVIQDHQNSESQFELYEDRSNQWRWRLRHHDGTVIGASNKGYETEQAAQFGLQAVRRDAFGASMLIISTEEKLPEEGESGGFVNTADGESKATFEYFVDEDGEHRWRLRHDNGEIIAQGAQGYASKNGVEHSVKGIRKYVGPAEYLKPDPTAIEIFHDEAGEYRWRLYHRNGNRLGDSGEGYANRAGARQAIDHLRETIHEREIEVYKDEGGAYRWRIAGGDEKIKFDSWEYESRAGAAKAGERVRKFLPDADLIDIGEAAFQIYEDEADEYRWRLHHRNGNILANCTHGYADRSGLWDGIESVKLNAPNAAFQEIEG